MASQNYGATGKSDNFVWNELDELGHGACGFVFRGMDKRNGNVVAVKVFNRQSIQNRTLESQIRELEILKTINHENIVKTIAIEKQRMSRTGANVIVMEYCSGGSLFKILCDPENAFGLLEDEFVLVLSHLSAGTKYLRQNNIVHRDLKPANIMKFIGDDGMSVYKLADFDAARKLHDEQEYMSLYGTEEYLSPDMYEQLLNFNPVKKFTASTDLWSIGATLYHVATGQLPFRPFGDRSHSEFRPTLLFMTTKKDTGVICTYQTLENGTIYQETELPKTCHLSPSLQKIVTPLLVKLLEANPQKKTKYQDFFNCVDEILSRNVVHVFYLNKMESFRMYLNSPHEDIHEALQNQTGVLKGDQLLLFKDTTLETLVKDGILGTKNLPETSDECPLILINRNDSDVSLPSSPNALQELKFMLFPNQLDVRNDVKVAEHNTKVGHVKESNIKGFQRMMTLLQGCTRTIDQVVVAQLTAVSKERLQINTIVGSLHHQFSMMKGFRSVCESFCKARLNDGKFLTALHALEDSYAKESNSFEQLRKRLSQLEPALNRLLDSRVGNRWLILEWEIGSSHVKNLKNVPKGVNTAKSLVLKMRDSLAFMTSDEQQKEKFSNEEYNCRHLMERLKIKQSFVELDRLERNMRNIFQEFVATFSDWYKKAQTALMQPEIIANDLCNLRNDMLSSESRLASVVKSYVGHMNELAEIQNKDVASNGNPVPHSLPPRTSNSRKKSTMEFITNKLEEEIAAAAVSNQMFDEHSRLCSEIEGIVAQMSSSMTQHESLYDPELLK